MVTPTDVPIKVDPAAFSDPGSVAAAMASTTQPTAGSVVNKTENSTTSSQPAGN
jgi:hypothetical protein